MECGQNGGKENGEQTPTFGNESQDGRDEEMMVRSNHSETFRTVLTMVRRSYLSFNLYANEREEAVVLINHIVNGDKQLNEETSMKAMKALGDIVERSSLDFVFRSHQESSDDMVKLREQLAIIWQLFLRMNAVDQEHARNLLKELSQEDVSSVLPLPVELLTKMALMLGGQNSDNSFLDLVRLADTCRAIRSAVRVSIRQMPDRVMLIEMNWSCAIVNGVRVSKWLSHPTLMERVGALVALGQPNDVIVRPMARPRCPPPDYYPLLMSLMVPLTAVVHLCCLHHHADARDQHTADLLRRLDEASCALITSVCCAPYRPDPGCLQFLSYLPNCRKVSMNSQLMLRGLSYQLLDNIGRDALDVCCSVDGHRGKTLELRIRISAYCCDAQRTYARDDTSVRVMIHSSESCNFNRRRL